MNIAIDARLLSRGGYTGIEEYASQMIEAILKSDRRNHYFLFYNGFSKARAPELWLKSPNATVLDYRVPNKIFDLSARLFNRPKLENFCPADLIYSPHFNIAATNKPRVVTFHDLSFLHHPDFFSIRHKLWQWLQNYRKQALDAREIIVNSEFTKNDLMELLKIPEEKITVIYPGLREEFKPIPKNSPELITFKEKYHLGFPFILFLGTLEPRKNIQAAIRAFTQIKNDAEFKDYKLIIAGKRGWLYQEIIKEAKQSPSSRDIIFWGPVNPEEKILLYNAAELFVYPSFFEGFGFPPLEAQACGLPVIAAERTSLPEILGNSAILIDPWRLDRMAQAIKTILNESRLYDDLRAKGLANSKKFRWPAAAQKLIGVFKKYR